MALIPVYHVVPSYYPVDPDYDISGSGEIKMGMFVTLDGSGFVAIANAANAMGVAGDSLANTSGYTPYSADLIISGAGTTRSTSNRVSDFFDETAGSGMMTVYHSGGEFWTDQYSATFGAGQPGGNLVSTAAGLLHDVEASDRVVGRLIEGVQDYPSGVPSVGSGSVDQSLSLGSFVRFKLDL
jgi:hypothetical protein